MEVTAELETAVSPCFSNPAQLSDNSAEENTNISPIPNSDADNWLSSTPPTSSPFLPPTGGSSNNASGGFRKPNFTRRLSSTVTLSSFEDIFPIVDPKQLAKFDQLLLLFPSPPVPDPLVANASGTNPSFSASNAGSSSQVSSSPGNNGGTWSIKTFASSFFSSR
jgi:hypothetical protein